MFISSIFKDKKYIELASQFEYFESELKRTGVIREILWHEYKAKYPDGYSYSQFCYHFTIWRKGKNASMHMEHKPADKLYIDFAGTKLSYVDRQTGEIIPVEVLITCQGYSQLIYVQACYDQKRESFINGCENALYYYKGAPRALVPDNLKSAVTHASKYEPEINKIYHEFANHYGMCVYPARSRAPQDKSLFEKAVSIVYSRIYASLRNRTFSIDEINQAIWDLLYSVIASNLS